LRASIIDLKRRPHLANRLAWLMAEIARRPPLNRATRVLPVPLHPEREKQRGFNQATVLARAVAEILGLRFDEHALARREHTGRHRAGMDARARAESVEDAFAVVQPRAVAGEHILLVDDVFTTGATASACARMLREASAEEVLVLTIARPVR
jgi:ComF family protein